MFLKTVPPVLAIHTEWRSSKSCSLPLFFNDSASDSDLASASGTPLPQKIQMIIESLHGTQSSDMSDNMQTEKAAHSSHETSFKSQMRVMDMSVISRPQGTETKLWKAGSDTGEDSDSDDSVDRGIEEAIQEYLKEKVDHKRKGDPVTNASPVPKLQRMEPSMPDTAKQHTHSSSGKVLTASNHIQKASTGVLPLKKKVKKKKLSKEDPFKKADTSKVLPMKIPPPSRGKKGSSSSSEMDRSPPRLVIKEEEEWLDSSSDDGIEEEIQRFQQEKKDKQAGGKDALKSQKNYDTVSSSEKGIEEAICSFQEEKHQQKKKKSPLKPAQLVPAQRSKMDIVSPECIRIQPVKTMSKKNKKKLTAKKSAHPTPLAVSHFLNKCSSQNSKVKGFTVSPTNPKQTHTEHQISTSLKVNTAELLCAEAILDISKTVMHEEFDSNLCITNRNLLQTPTFPPIAPSDDKSEDSSVDSEDGIEQEIRNFLELKAKMNKELPTTTGTPSPGLGDPMAGKEPKKKMKETQPNKVTRLSLSRKRKFKEEQSKPFRVGDMVCNIKEEPSGKLLVHSDTTRSQISSAEHSTMASHSSCLTAGKNNMPKQTSPFRKITDRFIPKDKGSRYSSSSPTNSLRTLVGSERNDSSDKSSSLDSDEDLDAAIKDLLKTKKKVKKKVRDIKARKGVRTLETSPLDMKHKPTTDKKSIPPVKVVKSSVLKGGKETLNVQAKNDKGLKSKTVKSKLEFQESLTRTDRVTGNGGILNASTPDCDLPSSNPRADDIPDEDSSVDSDDSIEQEIQRFLAQRAKVAAPTAASIKQEEDVGESLTSTAEFGVKSEHQQIPVETPLSASAEASGRLRNDEECWGQESIVAQRQTDSPAEFDKGPVLTPGSSCIMGFRRTASQKFEMSTTRDPKNCTSSLEGKDVFSNKATQASHAIISTFFPTPSVGSGTPQHQNLFLMRPVNSSMSEVKDCSSTDCKELAFSHQSRLAPRTPLKDVISSICPSPASKTKPPMNSPTENPGVTTGDLSTPRSRTEGLNLHNHMKTEKRDRYLSDKPHLSPSVSHLCQPSSVLQPLLGSSENQVERDKTLQKANPLQVRQTETSESKTSLEERHREGGSDSKEEKVQAREEEEDEEHKCVDETDVESNEESKDQKVKGSRKQLPNQ